MNGNIPIGIEIFPEPSKPTPTESCSFVTEFDHWTVNKDHRIHDLGKHLHADATLLSVSLYPPVRDVQVDLTGRILTANVEAMLEDPSLPNAFLCDVVVEFNGQKVSRGFLGDLEDIFYVKHPQPDRFVNRTDPNSLCQKGQYADDGKKIGIDLGVIYMCGHQYHE